MNDLTRMDRREPLTWMLAASAAVSLPAAGGLGVAPARVGYGTDPNLMEFYKPGDLWPLTFTPAQRRTAAALCDMIIPADAKSPTAAPLNAPHFIPECFTPP